MLAFLEKNLVGGFMSTISSQVVIRVAVLEDLPAITDIYNEAIQNGVATFDTEVKSVDNRKSWFLNRTDAQPILVATQLNQVVAWASLNPWSDRAAYNETAEVSIYVHKDYRGKGIGGGLFEALMQKAEKVGLHYLLSRITEGNQISIDLHLQHGFSVVGVMHEVGFKFGKYLDVTLMEKIIKKLK